jgi:hypothetical protein
LVTLQIASESLEAYARTTRSEWILDWPGQLVLNCSQVWCCSRNLRNEHWSNCFSEGDLRKSSLIT